MIDIFLYKNRILIGVILGIVIIVGVSFVVWDYSHRKNINNENAQIAELKKQNDSLRQELSGQANKNIAGASSENTSDKININMADASELDKLPNIGPARAADIISYRESHSGGFQSIEEIKNIKGIGDKSFEDLKDLITVGEGE